jgi:hypothetical protein
MRWAVAVLFAFGLLSGCDDSGERQKSERALQEADLMSDSRRALQELEKRLLESVASKNGMITVVQPLLGGVQVFPTPASWKLNCSFLGMEAVFIFGPREDDYITVNLTDVRLSDEQCRQLAPSMAERIRSILQAQ